VAHWATCACIGDTYDEAKAFAIELAAQNGYRLLSAFDDPDVIAGQGTVGLEIAAAFTPTWCWCRRRRRPGRALRWRSSRRRAHHRRAGRRRGRDGTQLRGDTTCAIPVATLATACG
jgi:hypothetical protein